MSINSALAAGVSGLISNSSALAAISQNIANVNTVGYKRTSANFSSLVTSQTKGGTYAAGGVQALTHQYISQEGVKQKTSSNLDLAIDGKGFFVTTSEPENVSANAPRSFTRAGAFVIDKLGYLMNDAGLYLQGWPADPLTGLVPTDPTDISRLRSINVSGTGGTAQATSRVAINATLSNKTATNAAFAAVPSTYADGLMAHGTVTPDFTFNIPISDTQGGQRSLTMAFAKTDNPGEWKVEIYGSEVDGLVPAAPVVAADGLVSAGTVRFDGSGNIDMADAPTFGGLLNAQGELAIGASNAGAGPKWQTALGINGNNIRLDLTTAPGGLRQGGVDASNLNSLVTNGTVFGDLKDITIDDQGYVIASYDNSVVRTLAQIAIATFSNPDALTAINGNAYRVSEGSGTYTLKSPADAGAGRVLANNLENSTVDLSTEFTGLITTQRAYSASSKIITTADEMLEQLINIKR